MTWLRYAVPEKEPAFAENGGQVGFPGSTCHAAIFDRYTDRPTRYTAMRNLDAMESTGLGKT